MIKDVLHLIFKETSEYLYEWGPFDMQYWLLF